MENRLSKIEIIFTVIIFIIASIGIGLMVHNRVDKDTEELTPENYNNYMQADLPDENTWEMIIPIDITVTYVSGIYTYNQ